jgi:hypothetical protein
MPTPTQKKRLTELERQLRANEQVITYVIVYGSPPPKQPLGRRRIFENGPAITPVGADRTSCGTPSGQELASHPDTEPTGPEGLRPTGIT